MAHEIFTLKQAGGGADVGPAGRSFDLFSVNGQVNYQVHGGGASGTLTTGQKVTLSHTATIWGPNATVMVQGL